MTIAEMIERDRALHAEFTAIGDGAPLRFMPKPGDDPDRPFMIVSPKLKEDDGLFFASKTDSYGFLPFGVSDHMRRMIEYAFGFDKSFVLLLSPDLRFDVVRGASWSVVAHFRYGRDKVQSYDCSDVCDTPVKIADAIELWIGLAHKSVANSRGGQS